MVTISISTTRMASENYGYMAPIKAALDSSLAFLAKSFSRFSQVRFNAVAPGLLKTSASAGIPGYVDSYLYAEQATLRKEAVRTEEVAHVAAFLLSPRSSGINAQRIVVDAGMSTNYFDADLIAAAMRRELKRRLADIGWPGHRPSRHFGVLPRPPGVAEHASRAEFDRTNRNSADWRKNCWSVRSRLWYLRQYRRLAPHHAANEASFKELKLSRSLGPVRGLSGRGWIRAEQKIVGCFSRRSSVEFA